MSAQEQRKPYVKLFMVLCMTLLLAGWLTHSEASAIPTNTNSLQPDTAFESGEAYFASSVTVSDAVISKNTDMLELNLAQESNDRVYTMLDEAMPPLQNDETQKYYYTNSGSSLQQVVQSLRKQRYESAVGFRRTGEKLYDYTNFLPSRVHATSSYRRAFAERGGTLSIHNHPSNSPFSAKDLHTEASLGTPIAMVISDRYIYTVQPLGDSWGDPEAIQNYYTEQIEAYQAMIADYRESINESFVAEEILSAAPHPDDGSYKWFYRNEIRQQLLSGKTENITVPEGIWSMDKAMERVAEKFNLLYTRVETDKFKYNDDLFTPIMQTAYAKYYLSAASPVLKFRGRSNAYFSLVYPT